MKPPSYSDMQTLPLSSELAIRERVTALIGRAARRQLWLLFVDGDDVQLPLMIPIENHPSRPDGESVSRLAAALSDVSETSDAHGLIAVLERYGSAELTRSDLAWANAMHEASATSPLTMRAILLSHARGVRWVAPDDYLFERAQADGPG